jgi:hypothetical protein
MREATRRAAIAGETAETIITRFQARFEESLAASSPSKEWVRSAVERRGAPRCPVRIRRLSYDLIVRHGDALGGWCQTRVLDG